MAIDSDAEPLNIDTAPIMNQPLIGVAVRGDVFVRRSR
jgi:hypothetical protein